MQDSRHFYLWVVSSLILAYSWLAFQTLYAGDGKVVVCPSKLILGIPCAGCGLTRATLMFLRGEYARSMTLNPNVVFVMMHLSLSPILLATDLIFRKNICVEVFFGIDRCLKKRHVFLAFALCELGIWCHNIIMHI